MQCAFIDSPQQMQCGNDFCSEFQFWNRIFETKEKQLILNKCHIIAWWLPRVSKNFSLNHKQPLFMSGHKNFEIMWQASKCKNLNSMESVPILLVCYFRTRDKRIFRPSHTYDEATWNWILIENSDNKTEIIIINSLLQSFVYSFYEE